VILSNDIRSLVRRVRRRGTDLLSLGPTCRRVVEELSRLIDPDLIRVYGGPSDCTIDVKRPDVLSALRERDKSRWAGSYGTGSIWILESTKRMEGGDVVVPIEMKDSKVEEMERYGCGVEEVHEYREFGVAHIHGTCPVKDPREFAKLIVKS